MALMSRARTDTLSGRVATEIRRRLGELSQSQASLAAEMGRAPMWVSDRLSGKTEITLNDLERFADALGVTIADLLPRGEREVTLPYPSRPPGRRDSSGPGRASPVRLARPAA